MIALGLGLGLTHQSIPIGDSGGSSGATWNPSDKTAGMALSNGDLTATGNGVDIVGVRSTTSHTTGKKYYEFTLTTLTSNEGSSVPGFATAAYAFETGFLGDDIALSLGYYAYGDLFYNAASNVVGVAVVGDIIGLALDLDAGLAWVSVNGVFTGDPAAGTGGLDVSTMCADPVFAAWSNYADPDNGTANFGATAFNTAPPTGFGAWGA